MIRLHGDAVEEVSEADVEAMFRRLQGAARELTDVRDGTDKMVVAQRVFCRRASDVLLAALEIAQ